MREWLRLIYFNVACFCVLLVGMEVAGQLLFLIIKGHPVWYSPRRSHSALLENHPWLVGRLRSDARVTSADGRVVTSTPEHTRWTGAPSDNPKAVQIAVVGGSTTFGAGVTDTASWPAHLQRLLGPGYTVTNYGMLGYSTAEGIIQMALIIPETRPDIVVLYEGWNDIRLYHNTASPDYYGHGIRQFDNLGLPFPRSEPVFRRLVDVSAICRLVFLLSQALPGDTPAHGSQAGPAFDSPDPVVDRIYRRNLGTLRALARQSGAYALFVPQVMNDAWFEGHPGSAVWTPRVDDRAMPRLIRRLNRIMYDACELGAKDCAVYDAPAARHWSPEDFIDEGHFSERGGAAFARLLAEQILEYRKRHPT